MYTEPKNFNLLNFELHFILSICASQLLVFACISHAQQFSSPGLRASKSKFVVVFLVFITHLQDIYASSLTHCQLRACLLFVWNNEINHLEQYHPRVEFSRISVVCDTVLRDKAGFQRGRWNQLCQIFINKSETSASVCGQSQD